MRTIKPLNVCTMCLSAEGYCDPLGSYNVHAYLDRPNATKLEPKSVIVVAARVSVFE